MVPLFFLQDHSERLKSSSRRFQAAKLRMGAGLVTLRKFFLRRLYEVVFAAALFIPARTRREREARARHFALKIRENSEKHGPLGVAIALNALFLAGLGTLSVRTSTLREGAVIEASLGYFSDPQANPTPRPQDGQEPQRALSQAAAQMFLQPPAQAVSTMDATLTTTAQFPLAFAVPGPADPSTEALRTMGNAVQAMATGETSPSRNASSPAGTKADRPSANGEGPPDATKPAKLGPFQIQGERIGAMLDVTSSMGYGDLPRARQEIKRLGDIPCIETTDAGAFDKDLLRTVTNLSNQGVTAIYWFSDMGIGEIDPEILSQFRAILREKRIRLYVHSTNLRRPEIVQLAEESGGAFRVMTF